MEVVTISPNYEIIIPREVRERLGLEVGQKVHVFASGNRIEIIPRRPAEEMMGSLPGLDTEVEREEDRLG